MIHYLEQSPLAASYDDEITATGLSAMLDDQVSHDQVTRLLSKKDYDSKDLWIAMKKEVREIEDDSGVFIFDDSVQEKNL